MWGSAAALSHDLLRPFPFQVTSPSLLTHALLNPAHSSHWSDVSSEITAHSAHSAHQSPEGRPNPESQILKDSPYLLQVKWVFQSFILTEFDVEAALER